MQFEIKLRVKLQIGKTTATLMNKTKSQFFVWIIMYDIKNSHFSMTHSTIKKIKKNMKRSFINKIYY